MLFVLRSNLASEGIKRSSSPVAMAEVNNQQAEEAAAIKAAHPGRCRVMTDVGRFSHVITVQPMNMDATIKFQLEGRDKNSK